MTGPDAPPHPDSPIPADELGRALLLDLCAWLGAWPGPVPADVAYAPAAIRSVEGGQSRLARYLPPELLRRWNAALSPLLAGGQTVDVRLSSFTFQPTARGSGRIDFTHATGHDVRRWRLEIRVDHDRELIRDAWFTGLER